jgi:predicted metal-binding membrane protein
MNDRSISVGLDRDRIAVLTGLILVVAAGSIYLIRGAGLEMGQMAMDDGMAMMPDWTPGYTALVFIMWAVMMTTMMLPGGLPAIDRIARNARGASPGASGIAAAVSFAVGYLFVWITFGLVATILQRELASRELLSETMALRSTRLAALSLIAIGLYQFAPLKRACLSHCRTMAACVRGDQYPSTGAMLRQGARYGISCAGCCAALMGVLFVAGVMNLFWVAMIALWVLAEKSLPWGTFLARLAGLGLIGWGGFLLALPS